MKKVFLILLLIINFQSCYAQNNYNFDKVEDVINEGIKNAAFPGAVVLIWKDGETVFHKGFGNFTYSDTSTEVTTGTIYDLASLTKVIATTTAAMICVDRNIFSINDKVVKYIPEFSSDEKDSISIKNLLLHNSGLPAWKSYYTIYKTDIELIEDLYSLDLTYKTGSKTVYSDLGFVLLGKVIERATGMPLDKFCEENIFDPIEMDNTFFNPPSLLYTNIAPTEIDRYWRNRLLQGVVHDEISSLLKGVAGNAGLFSTAEDIAKLMKVLLNNGMHNNKQFLKKETIQLFTKRYSTKSTRALGWDTKSETGSSAGKYFSIRSFGHLGYTGTSVWADPERNLFVVFLTNRVHPTRENNKIRRVRPALHNSVIECIEAGNYEKK